MIHKQASKLLVPTLVFMALIGLAGCRIQQQPPPPAGTSSVTDRGLGNLAHVDAVVGGGSQNIATVQYAVVSGGIRNTAGATRATIGGGYGNTATALDATVGGGGRNTASGIHATIGGGSWNTAGGYDATIGGGSFNVASGTRATVGGGSGNIASDFETTIAGGAGNTASGTHATVCGGLGNQATGIYAVAGGGHGNSVTGAYSTVPGGSGNRAAGDFGFASGQRAMIAGAHDGTFMFADSSPADFHSEQANEFAVRSTGGVRFVSALDDSGQPLSGVRLAPGSGSWSTLSAREAKENLTAVDGVAVLDLLATLPLSTWSYAGQDPAVRHLGPMAQEFRAAFGLGEDGQHISTVDADGVALAALQGLHRLLEEKDAQIASQQSQILSLEARVEALEQGMNGHGPEPMAPSASPLASWLLGAGLILIVGLMMPPLMQR
jgi:hypothetical protein